VRTDDVCAGFGHSPALIGGECVGHGEYLFVTALADQFHLFGVTQVGFVYVFAEDPVVEARCGHISNPGEAKGHHLADEQIDIAIGVRRTDASNHGCILNDRQNLAAQLQGNGV
jgi:hypothetical protein